MKIENEIERRNGDIETLANEIRKLSIVCPDISEETLCENIEEIAFKMRVIYNHEQTLKKMCPSSEYMYEAKFSHTVVKKKYSYEMKPNKLYNIGKYVMKWEKITSIAAPEPPPKVETLDKESVACGLA